MFDPNKPITLRDYLDCYFIGHFKTAYELAGQFVNADQEEARLLLSGQTGPDILEGAKSCEMILDIIQETDPIWNEAINKRWREYHN
jgi:hypothetical protein